MGKECTYFVAWSSLSQPAMRRDHHWRHQLQETLHTATNKSPRIKMGWKKRRLYKRRIRSSAKIRKGKKKAKKLPKKQDPTLERGWKECTYLRAWSSLYRPAMRRDHHWRQQQLQTLHHKNTKKSMIKNGFEKKEEGALFKKTSVLVQKEKGKRETSKKELMLERGGECT